jgi:uncharacterized membrane protein YhaH (DUF805 family)
MAIRASDLLRLRGTIGRVPYLLIGCGLSAVKILLDRIVATQGFGRPWGPFNYAVPSEVAGLFSLSAEDRVFFGTMLGVALPFAIVGVTLTVRRLRDARLPLWLVVLFFAPVPVNLIFYLVLSVLPSRPEAASPLADVIDVPDQAKKAESENWLGAALAAILLPLPFGVLFTWMGTYVLRDYGWGVFVGIPFALPMISVVLFGRRRPRGYGECLTLGMAWLACLYAGLTIFLMEGIICLLMALPLALPIVLLGASVGYLIQRRPLGTADVARLVVVVLAALPAMIGAEPALRPGAPVFAVRTAVEVDAAPERVWARVLDFPDLPPPDDAILRSGVAYPVRARIEGRGVGAVRHCQFSTGEFVEPIEVWDEPRLLRFAVTDKPPPMREWGLFGDVHPPHLDDFLVSRRGQFLLRPLPGGRTLLEGTTWYQHHLWPASYWRLWSDGIIHRIHGQVLRHVKRLAEADAAGGG